MLNGVDINQVKQYNSSLKEYKEKAAQIKAHINFNTAELNRLCKELSQELNQEITPDNIEAVRDELVKGIENKLMIGNRILESIKNGEDNIRQDQGSNGVQLNQVNQVTQVNQVNQVRSVQVQDKQSNMPNMPNMPNIPNEPVLNTSPVASLNSDSVFSSMTPIFGKN